VTELQHPHARGFEVVAGLYERVRPEYPSDAVAWLTAQLDLRPGRTVLDLGAGTGKLTRHLVATGARVIAVEPGAQMLAELRRVVPQAEAHLAAAEEIPLPDDAVDAVTVAQAFHWFRPAEALREIHRVLRPRGTLALIWNTRDRGDPFQRRIDDLLEPFRPRRQRGTRSRTDALRASDLFGPLAERRFAFSTELDANGVVERIASISLVASAPPEMRAALERDLRQLVAETGGRVDFAYTTSAYVTTAA
jgi:SAM-dependent methyltransferase